jgi:hypothetical protein
LLEKKKVAQIQDILPMKKTLKTLLPILIIIIVGLFFFKNDLMLWNVVHKYKTDPSSVNPWSDISEEICADAQEEILNAYLEKPKLSEENLASTVKLIEFLRSCDSEPSTENKKPLDKKTFDILMDIYAQTNEDRTHSKIAYILRKGDITAFYKYFEITQQKDWIFFDGNSGLPTEYPEIYKELGRAEKDLWCEKVQAKVEADFIALLEADSLKDGVRRLQLLEMYEEVNCKKDRLHLRKWQFLAWSALLANVEKDFYASKNPKDIDFQDLINASHEINREAKNELESTSFYALLSAMHFRGDLVTDLDKKLIIYFMDAPIESRIMCWKIVFFICNQYGTSMDKDIVMKAKEWRKLVAEKYPDFLIEKEWKDQMGMARLAEIYREHGEF